MLRSTLVALLTVPLTAQVAWQQLDGPQLSLFPFASPGSLTSVAAYDATRSRLVVIDHGEHLFEHDGTRWLDRSSSGSPVFLIHDPVGQRLLRGFQGVGGMRLESWNGVAWSALPGVLAGLTSWGSPVFDPVRNRLVFPAKTGSWAIHEWNGTTWQLAVALPNTLGYHSALAYDPVQARTVLRLPIAPSTGWDEAWSWNGTTLTPLGAIGGSFLLYGSFWNPAANRIEFVANGSMPGGAQTGLFTWTGGPVQFLAALPSGSGAGSFSNAVCDPNGRVHLVARTTTTGPGGVWVLQGGSWQLAEDGNGALRVAGTMAFAPTQGQAVFTGGYAQSTRFQGTSLWDGQRWSWTAAAPTPLRGQSACATDPLGRGVVLFGGEADTGNPFGYAVRGDTWLWNGTAWLSQTSGPPARARQAMVLDTARQRVVMCGGHASPTGSPVPLADTWEWDGAVWTQLANMPLARARHALAYDAVRARTVLFGGQDTTGTRDDTLEWDGVAWTTRTTPVKPPAGLPAMAFDLVRGVVTLVVHTPSTMTAWNWDGSVWAQDLTPLPVVVGANGHQPQVVYDSVRGRVLYHNGVALHAFSPTPASSVAYGAGCGRAIGFTLAHPPRPGGVLQCDLVDALPNGFFGVAVGLGSASINIGNGCTLLTQNGIGSRLAFAQPSGFAPLRFNLPNEPTLRGLTVYMQGAVLDANSPAGFALTAGLAVTVGD